jgi:betaine-homocysteine S-methyltransferase
MATKTAKKSVKKATKAAPKKTPGLMERLAKGPVICAEGYLFEFERRGYLQAGAFVPEVVLEHPEVVQGLHREFVHAGSDVVEAFTYYGHREKLRLIGKEDLLEPLNRGALALAGTVARESGALLAGNLSNTNVVLGDEAARRAVRAMFDEQVAWAAEAGADFLIGETFSTAEEALIALDAMRATGMPTVITLTLHQDPETRDGLTAAEACARLEAAGADVVGLNCSRGPRTMMPMLEQIREAVDCHVAAQPVPYRTTPEQPNFEALKDADGVRGFPIALEPFQCNRFELAEFAAAARDLGVGYIGLCCGGAPHFIRAMAERLGRTVPASRYSPDMAQHPILGEHAVKQAERFVNWKD